MRKANKKETTTQEIAKNVFLYTSKMKLENSEDLAHTLYTYTVSSYSLYLMKNGNSMSISSCMHNILHLSIG